MTQLSPISPAHADNFRLVKDADAVAQVALAYAGMLDVSDRNIGATRPSAPPPGWEAPPVGRQMTFERLMQMAVGSKLSLYGSPFEHIQMAQRRLRRGSWKAVCTGDRVWLVERIR